MVERVDISFRITCPLCGSQSLFNLKPKGLPARGLCGACNHPFEQGSEIFGAIKGRLKKGTIGCPAKDIS